MSDCGCILIDCDGDVATFFNTTTPISLKVHTCTECQEDIKPGTQYERVAGTWGGKWDTFKTCPTCLSIRGVFFCEGYVYTMILADVSTHIEDMEGNISSECLMELTEPARKRIIEMLEEYWDET